LGAAAACPPGPRASACAEAATECHWQRARTGRCLGLGASSRRQRWLARYPMAPGHWQLPGHWQRPDWQRPGLTERPGGALRPDFTGTGNLNLKAKLKPDYPRLPVADGPRGRQAGPPQPQ
jgi:hypothetical protein